MPRNRRNRLRDDRGGAPPPAPASATLVVSVTDLTIRTVASSTAPQADSFTVRAGAGGPLFGPTVSVAYTDGSGWLTATPRWTSRGLTVTCSVLPGASAAGDYVATVTVDDPNAAAAVDVTVTMSIAAPAAVLRMSWANGDGFTTTAGTGVSSPLSRAFTVTNAGPSGSGPIDPVVDDVSVSWMDVTRSGSDPTWTFTLAPNSGISTLTQGVYPCLVTIADANGNAPVSVSGGANINVSGATASPILNSSVNGFSFTGVQGGSNPTNQTASLTNVGSGTLAGPTASVTGAPWCSVAVTGSSAPYTLTVGASLTGLTAGTYSAIVSVADANASATIDLPVTLTVTPVATTAPVLAVAPSPTTFAYTTGGALPATQTSTISNSGTGSLSGPTASTTATWLSLLITAGASGTWTLQYIPNGTVSGLAAGSYSGTVTIHDAAAAQDVVVSVGLTVTAAGAVSAQYNGTNLPVGDNQVVWNPATRRIEGRVVDKPDVSYYTGTVWTPANSSAFQTAINNCGPRDIIELTAGVQYTGPFTVPAGKTDWFLVRTGNGSLYNAGTRRTDGTGCAIIQTQAAGNGKCMNILKGGGYVHFQDLHFRLNPASGGYQGALVECSPQVATSTGALVLDIQTLADVPHHVGIERCFLDGGTDQASGLRLRRGFGGYMRYCFVEDSAIVRTADNATDAQAIGLISCDAVHIENCRLEGYGENVLFGGANEALPIPTCDNVLIRRCYFTNDTSWDNQVSTYGVRKNNHEIKNGRRICITECYGEKSWSQGQTGWNAQWRSNQSGSTTNPQGRDNWCLDCLMINNHWDSVGYLGGFGAQNTVTTTAIRTGRNQWVHELYTNVGFIMPDGAASSTLAQRAQVVKPGGVKRASLDWVGWDHLTIIPATETIGNNSPGPLYVGDLTPPVASDDLWPEVRYTNCVVPFGNYGVLGRGGAADLQCAVIRVKGNLMYGPKASRIGAGNTSAATMAGALPNSGSGDYATLAAAYRGTGVDAATGTPDGSDPGADVAHILALTANVIAGTP